MAAHPATDEFHPVVRTWFQRRFAHPTEAQDQGWMSIASGHDVLIAAATGSGKTLAAFLVGIDQLIRKAESAGLPERTEIVYVSPLKALSNDISRNLEEPLREMGDIAVELGIPFPEIRVGLRTGDTPQAERQGMVRRPPHILVTTPESLYLMVTARRSRANLRWASTVIVDEIHALAGDRRGSHLSLTLARLDHVVAAEGNSRLRRIGLSATQRPIESIASFLVGTGRPCRIVDLGHQRDLELAVEVPPSDLEAVAPREQWEDVYRRLGELVTGHRTTLVFVNTRNLCERVAHNLSQLIGEDAVASHHGSLSRERRLKVEQRLKSGELKALVATASLELGIDIGNIDLVCQIGSPGSIATFLQRVGRSGHALGLRPHGRLFPTTRDQLVECAALVRAVRAGNLDQIRSMTPHLDVLAQQIVAEVSAEEWGEDDLFDLFREATPFADLTRREYDEIVEMLSRGIGEGAGRAAPLVHRDGINRVLRPRRAARLAAIQNGGTIPELGDYRVVSEPEGILVGTVNEDFAVESAAGDIFLLGSTSWRITRVEQSTVRVADAHGAPPTIPFWLGEAPGRTLELSEEVGRLRRDVAEGLDDPVALRQRLIEECSVTDLGADQVIDYVRATRDGLGVVPSHEDVVFERFFDDSGGMQLVVHAPFGQRINRAWGLALRKRFCTAFDFELQAAANDDSILLSSGPQHSWPLDEAFGWVNPANVEMSVHKSVFYIPLFPTRWRWNLTRALAVPRQRGGRKVPPFLQRLRADDLMAAVFPEQVGCQEHMDEPLSLPDHPLMHQTMRDCLFEAMDVSGLRGVLEKVEQGEIRYHARDTTEPSPMAHEIVSGRPYTFLDDAPLEERRTRAVRLRHGLPESVRDLAALDPEAITRVADQAWPRPRDVEETHDALLGLGSVVEGFVSDWIDHLHELEGLGRAGLAAAGDTRIWFAAENIEVVRLLFPAALVPDFSMPEGVATRVDGPEEARALVLRGHSETSGVVSAALLAARVGLDVVDVDRGLRQLEARGYVLRGRFSPGADTDEFCDRGLLARIHRYTLDTLRRAVDPVSKQDYMRFLVRWQGLHIENRGEGRSGLRQVIHRLRGFEAPAGVWETQILAARMVDYQPSWLDELCLGGEVAWARLTPRRVGVGNAPARATAGATRATPVTLTDRVGLPAQLASTRWYMAGDVEEPAAGAAAEILQLLGDRGALFFDEVVGGTSRIMTDIEQGLRELIAAGLVTSDGFQGLRELAGRRRTRQRGHPRRSPNYLRGGLFAGAGPPGRWSRIETPARETFDEDELAEEIGVLLLDRYGVVFRDLWARESMTIPWRLVLRALRRMEARGVVRGGHFVGGVVGEQYALPEAVSELRRVRNEPKDGKIITINATDPVNLTGIVLPGNRVPATPGRTITLVDGVPVDPVDAKPLAGAARH